TLLALGVQPLAAGGEPFARVRLALEQEQEALARELLESGLKDRVLEPAWRDEGLVLALRARAWTLAARLLSEGARVRAPVAAGPTALSLAASDGGPWMQELFLSMGATDSTGAALEVLLGRGEGEAVRRLLREGRVPPDIAFARLSASPASHALLREWSLRSWKALSRENQEALLRLAVGRDDDALAIFLMEQAGLDARLQDEAGRTLLHLAAGQAGPKLVEYLVSRGVPLDAEAPRCVRALDLARERGDREGSRVARLLEEQGATAGGCAGPATGE
ncbi:MAG: ankyrin repeat domain-containing protein, partial [Cystobacter sp.]